MRSFRLGILVASAGFLAAGSAAQAGVTYDFAFRSTDISGGAIAGGSVPGGGRTFTFEHRLSSNRRAASRPGSRRQATRSAATRKAHPRVEPRSAEAPLHMG